MVLPASSGLIVGQSLSDTENWGLFTSTSNYITQAAGQMISSVQVNYTGDTVNETDLIGDGDLNSFSVTVTDTAGNQRTFSVIPQTVTYAPPTLAGARR